MQILLFVLGSLVVSSRKGGGVELKVGSGKLNFHLHQQPHNMVAALGILSLSDGDGEGG